MAGQLTITEKSIETEVMKKLPPQAQSIVMRVYTAGMKVLFSPQTHGQVVQGFEQQMQQGGSADMASHLGTDLANLMLLLFKESKGTMPKGAMIPAGTMLLAKCFEFIASTNSGQVDDNVFADATHFMTSVLLSKFNKGFAAKIGAPQPGQQPVGAQPQPAAPQAAPAPGALGSA